MKHSVSAAFLLISVPLLGRADVATEVVGCNACHGPDGVSQQTDVPTIAGISAIVIEDAIYAYRDGDRGCSAVTYGGGIDACTQKNALSENDISGLAEHYAALSFVAAEQDTDAGMAAQGKAIHDRYCEICHSQGGANPDDDAGILAGQQMGYLRKVMTEYQAGERPQPRPMEMTMTPLSAADIDALAHYYGSLR
jgi:sulfide dehydrogenase cytochrome subunit